MIRKYENYSLLPYHTFGMDVKAAVFVEYSSVDELKQVLEQEVRGKEKWLHIGGGSNLLFTGDFDGTILHSAIKGYEVLSDSEEERSFGRAAETFLLNHLERDFETLAFYRSVSDHSEKP